MRRRHGFSLVELLIVVAIIGILASLAVPNFLILQSKAKRAEVPANVSGIWVAEIAYDAMEDGFVALSTNPTAPPGRHLRAFELSGTGWRELGWQPDGDLRGSYSVDISLTEFTVFGEGDVDGDSVLCQYTATDSQAAVLRSGDENVY